MEDELGTLPASDQGAFSLVASIVVLVWYALIWTLCLIGCWTARHRYRIRPKSPLSSASRSSVQGVSILRPVKGLDANLFENLESTFVQEYPNFEIILSVAEESDQALPVIRDVMAKHPRVDAKVIIGEEVVGLNPKVNNLVRSYQQAQNDILWVLDSNVLVAPGTLARSVDSLIGSPSSRPTRRIGVVHHVPFAIASEPTFGSGLEEAFLNTTHAKMYLAINALAVDSCVTGKSNMYRRSDVDRVNGDLKPFVEGSTPSPDRPLGLAAFGRFLAEDNMIAGALWHELGLRHDLSCDVANNILGGMTFGGYISRRVRWVRVRKHMVVSATLVEPLTECVVLSLLGAWAFQRLFDFPPSFFLLLHYGAWITLDLDIYAALAGHPVPSDQKWKFLVAWLARELLALPIWIRAIIGSEVVWRGKMYRVVKNGCLDDTSASSSAQPDTKWFWRLSRWKGGATENDGYEPVSQDSERGPSQ